MDAQCPLNILLVEDNPGYARLLEEMLLSESHGAYKSCHATSLSAARSKISREVFDIILLDLKLTDSEGLETLRILNDGVKDCPVLVLSGENDSAVSEQAKREGAVDFLVKGEFNAGGLVNSIHRAHRCATLIASQKNILDSLGDAAIVVGDAGQICYMTENTAGMFAGQVQTFVRECMATLASGKGNWQSPLEVSLDELHKYSVRQQPILWEGFNTASLYCIRQISPADRGDLSAVPGCTGIDNQATAQPAGGLSPNKSLLLTSKLYQAWALATKENQLYDALCQNLVDIAGFPLAWVYRCPLQAPARQNYHILSAYGPLTEDNESTLDSILTNLVLDGLPLDDTGVSGIKSARINRLFMPGSNFAGKSRNEPAVVLVTLSEHEEHVFTLGLVSTNTVEPGASDFDLLREIADTFGLALAKFDNIDNYKLYKSVLDQNPNPICITNSEGVIEYVNSSLEQVSGYQKQQLLGKTPALFKSGLHDEHFYRKIWQAILSGQVFRGVCVNRHKDGRLYYEDKSIAPIFDGHGEISHFLSTGKDVTDRLKVEERLQYLANYDGVTDLPNLSLFLDRIEQSIQRLYWYEGSLLLAVIRFDGLGEIREAHGYDSVDKLIYELTGNLSGVVRKGDTISRLDSGDLGLLFDDFAKLSDIKPVIDAMRKVCAADYRVNDNPLALSYRIGLACYPDDGSTAAVLLQGARAAAQSAGNELLSGSERVLAAINAPLQDTGSLEDELRSAVDNSEFEFFLQPFINVADNSVAGTEMLLRWNRPGQSIVPPNEFLRVLEDTKLILPVGRWLLEQAFTCKTEWQKLGIPNLTIAVNISPNQLEFDNLGALIQELMQKYPMSWNFLELEISERAFVGDMARVISILRDLFQLGVKLSIDDFGSGYCPLSYLSELPVHAVKIHKNIIADVTTNANNAEIVRSVTSIAHALNVSVIAKGVETTDQLTYLQQQGCDLVQGFLYSRPVAVKDMTDYLLSHFNMAARVASDS